MTDNNPTSGFTGNAGGSGNAPTPTNLPDMVGERGWLKPKNLEIPRLTTTRGASNSLEEAEDAGWRRGPSTSSTLQWPRNSANQGSNRAHDSAMAAYQANLQVDNDVFQGPRIKVRGRRHNRGRSASSFSFQRQNNAQNPGNTSGLNSNPNSNEMQARDKVSLQNYKITKINSNQAGDANRGANYNPNLNPNIRFKF
jgi:hypothetical protein